MYSILLFFCIYRNIDGHFRLRGVIKVPVELVNQRCAYKYVLVNKDMGGTYEKLVEFKSHDKVNMNRCLFIGQENAVENSKR